MSTNWCTRNSGDLNVSSLMYPQDLLLTDVSVCQAKGRISPSCPRSRSSTARSGYNGSLDRCDKSVTVSHTVVAQPRTVQTTVVDVPIRSVGLFVWPGRSTI